MSQTVIQRLAERIRSFGDKNVTKQAIELSRTAIIDTIGVTLAGSVEPCATNLLRTPGIAEAPGPCTLFGTQRKTSALDATFFNGTASHALDYDDFSQPMGGHQSTLSRPGDPGSNPSLSSTQSVSAVDLAAVSAKPRTLAVVCGWLGREKGRGGREPGLLRLLLHFGIEEIEAAEAVRRRLDQVAVVIRGRPPSRLRPAPSALLNCNNSNY